MCNPRSTESTRTATLGRPRAAAAMLISPERGEREKAEKVHSESVAKRRRGRGQAQLMLSNAVSRNKYRCVGAVRQAGQSSFKRKGSNLIQKGKPKPKEGEGGENRGEPIGPTTVSPSSP